ncbi:hypothetical protein HYU93_01995 [Candidatus Daviesbacteria bacterium]|nr:hypothetical protein [Candidatus Daviesbacteria bacterium]
MKKFSIFTFAFLLLTFPAPVFAQANTLEKAKIDPASPLYFLKSVREILELKLAGTTHIQVYRQIEFATRRVREVNSLVNTPNEDLIEPTLARYLSHLQELNKLASAKDQIVAVQIVESVTQHMSVLQKIYSQVSNPSAIRSIRTTIYRLSEWNYQLASNLSALNKYPLAQRVVDSNILGCNLLAREASSSALNGVEKAVFEKRAKDCLTKLSLIRL